MTITNFSKHNAASEATLEASCEEDNSKTFFQQFSHSRKAKKEAQRPQASIAFKTWKTHYQAKKLLGPVSSYYVQSNGTFWNKLKGHNYQRQSLKTLPHNRCSTQIRHQGSNRKLRVNTNNRTFLRNDQKKFRKLNV